MLTLQKSGISSTSDRTDPKNPINDKKSGPREVMREKRSERSEGATEGYARMAEERMAEIEVGFEECIHDGVGGSHLCNRDEGSA
jgi:hypothetical protein